MLLLSGLFLQCTVWRAVLDGRPDGSISKAIMAAGALLLGFFFALRAWCSRVRLSEIAIEVDGLTGKSMLPLDKIEGRRRYLDGGSADAPGDWHLVLEPIDDRFPRLDIEEIYRFDAFFYQWFNGLPDLDERDKLRPKSSNFGSY